MLKNAAVIARRARRDERQERRTAAARNTRVRNRMALPERDAVPPREPGEFRIRAEGQVFDLVLIPDRRDSRRWFAMRDGKPFAHGGLDAVFREIQRLRVPLMGARNLM